MKSLEEEIKEYFKKRASFIPSLFEVSEPYLNRHAEVFQEIIKLRNIEFYKNRSDIIFAELIETESFIHHELNFIFKVCNKHKELVESGKFIYVREMMIENSYVMGKHLAIYKLMLKKYNSLVRIKNYSIIGLLVPIRSKVSI